MRRGFVDGAAFGLALLPAAAAKLERRAAQDAAIDDHAHVVDDVDVVHALLQHFVRLLTRPWTLLKKVTTSLSAAIYLRHELFAARSTPPEPSCSPAVVSSPAAPPPAFFFRFFDLCSSSGLFSISSP